MIKRKKCLKFKKKEEEEKKKKKGTIIEIIIKLKSGKINIR